MAMRLEASQQNARIQSDVVKAELAERVYQRMVAAGIFTDASPKNRILTDIFNAIDVLQISFAKTFNDQTTVDDLAAITLARWVTDSTAVSDVSSMWFGLNATEVTTLVDVLVFSIGQVFTDTTTLSDIAALQVAKTATDSATLSDEFTRTVGFYRSFLDTVALDDFSNIDKAFDATKHNVATAIDTHYWTTSKVVEDAASIADINHFTVQKTLADIAAASDAVDRTVQFQRAFTESIGVSDVLVFQISNGAIPVFNGVTFNSSTFG